MSHVLVLNGPNLNLLGRREPGTYGTATLADIERELRAQASGLGLSIDCFQSNAEGTLVERVHAAGAAGTAAAIVNPAAYTHTSVALRDAFLAVALPFVEVHLSNVHRREPFRHHSYFSDIALGTIVGLGPLGYSLALTAVAAHLAAAPDARSEGDDAGVRPDGGGTNTHASGGTDVRPGGGGTDVRSGGGGPSGVRITNVSPTLGA